MLLFLDFETTGLRPKKDAILEVACALMDNNNEVVETYESVIITESYWKNNCDQVVWDMHTENGLWKALESATKTRDDVLDEMIELFMNWQEKYAVDCFTLAGNSIHFDRRFIKEQLGYLDTFLHYRMVDNSSTKIMFQRAGLPVPEPRTAHRAMADVMESIRYYKFFDKALKDLCR